MDIYIYYYSWTCRSLLIMDYDYPSLFTTPMMDFSDYYPDLPTVDVGVFYVSSPGGPVS